MIRTLWRQPDFAAVEAVDIQDRETPMRLLNLYEGPLLHRYGRIYSQIEPGTCRPFRGVFLEREALAAVFQTASGTPVDQVFFKGDGWSWRDRLFYAQELLHGALLLTDLPPEISCAVLLSVNLLFDLANRKINFRFLISPMEQMNARELVFLVQDQLKKILPGLPSRPAEEEAFFDSMDREPFSSMVPLYSRWREAEPAIRAGYEAYEEKDALQKGVWLIKNRLADWRRGRET